MKDISKIVAENLISLRKKHNLTQMDLAKKLQYSDNTVSRWEHAEITPTLETLQKIAELYEVPIEFLLKENINENIKKQDKLELINKLSTMLLMVSVVWFVAVITFIYGKIFFDKNIWQVFIWAIPISCLILLPFNDIWGKYVYKFTIFSVFTWTLILSIFLQWYQYQLWLIFFAGIPVQCGLVVWSFIKPKKKKEKN